MARNTTNLMAPLNLLLFLVVVAMYLLPAALAFYRDCESTLWIGLVNVFLGWTVFGWVIALGWAASGKVRTATPATAVPHKQILHGPLHGH
jgi:hypothetical protein